MKRTSVNQYSIQRGYLLCSDGGKDLLDMLKAVHKRGKEIDYDDRPAVFAQVALDVNGNVLVDYLTIDSTLAKAMIAVKDQGEVVEDIFESSSQN